MDISLFKVKSLLGFIGMGALIAVQTLLAIRRADALDLIQPCDSVAQNANSDRLSRLTAKQTDACSIENLNKGRLPELSLPKSWNINKALATPDWLTISFSALSQNNGTTAGVNIPEITSSNLYDLAIRLGPISGIKQASEQGSDEPRPQVDISSKLYRKIAINALFTQRAGQILSSYIPNQLNTQWNFGNGPVSRLGFLNIEYKSEGDFISKVKLGKLMQAEDFTMNPIQCYYSNFGFCGWAQGVPGMIAIPGLPFNSYGAVIAVGDEKRTNFRYGIYQIAPASFAPQLHGLDFSFDNGIGLAQFFELRLPILFDQKIPIVYNKRSQNASPSDWKHANSIYTSLLPPGTLTFGGWFGTGAYPKVADSSLTEPNNNGAYSIFSSKFPKLSLGLDHRIFISTGFGLSPNVQNFRSGGSAGLVIAGFVNSRPYDTVSIGVSYATYNEGYYLPGTTLGSFIPGTETAIEANYSISISDKVRIMPNIQAIYNPSGDGNRSAVVVGGIQVWFLF